MDKVVLKDSVLDEEEQAVMDDLENGFYRPATPEEEKKLSESLEKSKVNTYIRTNKSDIQFIKQKAEKEEA